MKKKKYEEQDGVWRTIGGRRVFIKSGQSLSDAMKESGKFKKNDNKGKKINETMDKRQKTIEKLDNDTKDLSPYDKYNLAVSKLENGDYSSPAERQYWVGEKERYIKNQKDTHIETKKYQPKEIEYVGQDGETHKMDSYEYPKEREEYHKFLQDKYGTYKEEEIKDETGITDYKKLRNEFYEKKELEDGLRKYIKDNFGTESEIYQRNYNEDGSTKTIEETRKYLDEKYGKKENKILSGNKGLSRKERDEMSPYQGGKLYSDFTDEEKQLATELHLRDMAMSAWTYGEDLHTDKDVNSAKGNEKYYNKPYINKFYDELGKERTEEILKQQKAYFNMGEVERNVSIDSEGLSYNRFVEPKTNRVVENVETREKYHEVGNGQWRSEKDGYDYYIDFNSSNKDNPKFKDIDTGKIINDNPRADNYWDYEGKGLKSRYKGTYQYLQNTTNMSGAEILELLKKIDEDKR